MNTAYFIARQIARPSRKSFSAFIIRIATGAVALSVAVMIVAASLVNGFTTAIAEKVFGFWGHIHIEDLTGASLIDQKALELDAPVLAAIRDLPGVESVVPFASKPGIIRAGADLERIFLKGVGSDYHWNFLQSCLVEGELPATADSAVSRDILLSKSTADRMHLAVNDRVDLYFVREDRQPLGRRFRVSGIYNSGLEEFDRLFAIGDLRVIQQINRWSAKEVGSYEVMLGDVRKIDEYDALIYYKYLPSRVRSMTIRDIRPNIFDWLKLQRYTGNIFLAFMLLVAVLNMVIALLILILDRTYMIGTLKALGGSNRLLQRIFLYCSALIIARGLIIGNLLGIGLCLIQQQFGIITLPEASYYVSVAPVRINALAVAGINAATVAVCLLFLLLPSMLIMKISPIKAIRFQ